jgi:hypothetical protein
MNDFSSQIVFPRFVLISSICGKYNQENVQIILTGNTFFKYIEFTLMLYRRIPCFQSQKDM